LIRIFKIKGFMRFQRKERIADAALIEAIRQAESGLVDADLGGGLIKQRIARLGQGKRGGYRTLIAFRQKDRAFFVFGFAKNERSNIGTEEFEELKTLAAIYFSLSENQIAELIETEELVELCHAQKE
jgi:hypothetical protein